MLLLSFAQANAAQPQQNLREWNARWAVLSATFGDTLGATDAVQTRAQGEQLFRWMHRAASQNVQITPLQVARLLHEWQAQSGVELPKIKNGEGSSTRIVLASQLPQFPQPQIALRTFATRAFVVSLPQPVGAKLAGVRSNRNHE